MVLLFVAAVILISMTAAVAVTVRRDGYGRIPPPRSHPPDPFDPAAARREAGTW